MTAAEYLRAFAERADGWAFFARDAPLPSIVRHTATGVAVEAWIRSDGRPVAMVSRDGAPKHPAAAGTIDGAFRVAIGLESITCPAIASAVEALVTT